MLASEAVTRAYREAAITPIGATLSADQLTEGLARLNGFLFSLIGGDAGEELADVQVPQNQRATAESANPINNAYPANVDNFHQPYTPGFSAEPAVYNLAPNSRIVWRGTTATTVYLPEFPSDGARVAFTDSGSTASLTINGNGRKIEGAATKVIASASASAQWFYRGDLSNWIVLAPLISTDASPLPFEFDDLLVSGTAMRLTALDELKISEGTMMIYNRLMKRIKSRYKQATVTTGGGENLVNSNQSYDWGPSW